MDVDKDGVITKDDLILLLKLLGEDLTEVSAEEMMEFADLNKDGKI